MGKLVILGIIKFYFICTENWLCSTRLLCITYYLWWKSFTFFIDYFAITKILVIFYTSILWKVVKAGNCKNYGNEGKDIKQRNFFTANNKQYMVRTSVYKFTNIQWKNYNLSINDVTTTYLQYPIIIKCQYHTCYCEVVDPVLWINDYL